MPIDREGAKCSECGKYKHIGLYPFKRIASEIQKLGWWVYKDKRTGWKHVCPDCQPQKQQENIEHRRVTYWWNNY